MNWVRYLARLGQHRSAKPGRPHRGWATGALCIGLLGASADAHAQYPVDLELVLAIDASGSVDDSEFRLQLRGIASAFRDPTVINAIERGFHGQIAVATVVWSDAHIEKDIGKWYVVRSAADAEAFALEVEYMPRRVRNGATGIGSGIGAAINMIRSNGLDGIRRVVDVSGDGVESPLDTSLRLGAMLLHNARPLAESYGVTINGLAIITDVPNLDDWYENYVKTGPGSFVMRAEGYEDFERAMRAKLLREIEQTAPVTLLDDTDSAADPVTPPKT